MPNFIDYIDWRGDLLFTQDPFNQIDSLILTRFTYLPLDELVTTDAITLGELYPKYILANELHKRDVLDSRDMTLFAKMAQSNRFKHIEIQHFSHVIHEEKQVQFCAMLLHLDQSTTYVAFRGTDATLVGWKEDFNMSYQTTVPSHNLSRAYLETYSSDLRENVIIGGHSKGGNLALYASLFVSEDIQNKIIAIHNFDGPGFHPSLKAETNYSQISDRIHTFIPETAIVGVLLNHEVPYRVVQSNAKGILQHDTYSWVISQKDFIYLDSTDANSKKIETTFSNILTNYTSDELAFIVDTFYQLLSATNIKDFRDFTKTSPNQIFNVLKTYQNLTKEDVEKLQQFTQAFISAMLIQ